MESDSPDFSSSEEEHIVADDEDLVKSSDDLEDSKESGVTSMSAWPRFCKYFKNKLFLMPEDLIGADIDSVRDDEDLVKSSYSLMAKGSMESIDSGVSFKSDRSRNNLINFKDRVSPSSPDFSSSEEELDVADDEDVVKSSDDL